MSQAIKTPVSKISTTVAKPATKDAGRVKVGGSAMRF